MTIDSDFRSKLFLAILIICVALTNSKLVTAQSHDHAGERKVITRVEPEYPDALKRLFIGGIVRVQVVVTPAGTVESTQLLGGNPILGQAAMKAIKDWKFAPGNGKATFVVPLTFDPHQ